MKRGTVIALVALVLVLIAFFATRKYDSDTVQPYVIKHVELGRIELTRPDNELVILEKLDSGWLMTAPVKAVVSEPIQKELDAVFATEIRTDDFRVSKAKLETYDLTDTTGTRVALFPKGATVPAVKFLVGREMRINERVRRSFIQTDRGKAYRAQRSLEFLRKPAESFRSKTILANDRREISNIKITTADGVVELVKPAEEWKMVSPEPGMRLEKEVVEGLVALLANLQASGFGDDKNPAQIGLDPPRATVVAQVGQAEIVLDLTHVGKDWYARKRGDSVIYTIGSATGNGLVPDLKSLRDRVPLVLDRPAIQTIEFMGAEKIIVTRNGESWTMLRPSKKEVKLEVFVPIVTTLAALRIARYEDVSLEEAGLDMPKERIILRSKGVKSELLFGSMREGRNDRYAKWASLPLIFIIPGNVAERLLPTTKDLIDI